MEQTFYGRIRDGRFDVSDKAGWKRLIESLEGKEVEVVLQRRRHSRTLEQNRFFHALCGELQETTGYSRAQMKEILKAMFLRVDDGKYQYVRPTSSLTIPEMSEFLDNCIQWAVTEFNFVVPETWRIHL